jgi:A/G-specific adenine glycosylase
MVTRRSNAPTISEFRELVWAYYKANKRAFAWRETCDPYHIVVSEVMLQQTQTARVMHKFASWVERFPLFDSLAGASLHEVLEEWSGLGYNRRGLALHNIAKIVVEKHNGILPSEPEVLVMFPGIGKATAASIAAFAFNKPTVFIETNIRSVFIHFFFKDEESVSDKEIMPLVERSVDAHNPREWYYALMDYGVMLKKAHSNPNKKSVHYTKQSRFEGSNRQIRSTILKALLARNSCSLEELVHDLLFTHESVKRNVDAMQKEGLLKETSGVISINSEN